MPHLCPDHCPSPGGGGGAAAVAVVAGVYVLAQVALALALAAAVALALAAASVPVMRHLARRACVPRWSAAYRPPVRRQRAVRRPALTRGPLAIEAPKPAVQGVIIKTAERTGHEPAQPATQRFLSGR